MSQRIARICDACTRAASSTTAFLIAWAFIIGWAAGGIAKFGFGDSYQLPVNTITTIVTFLVGFALLHSGATRDRATQVKLDAIVAALEGVSNRLIGLEGRSEAEIEAEAERVRASIDDHS